MTDRQVIVFRSRLCEGIEAQYDRHAEDVYRRATGMKGFVSAKDFIADDGERLAVIEWDSAGNLSIWRDDFEHRSAQQAGRDRYYTEYRIQICSELRSSTFVAATKEWTKVDRDPAVLRGIADRWLLEHPEYEVVSMTADRERVVIECTDRAIILVIRDGTIESTREFRS